MEKVLIIGAGLIGATLGYQLARAGRAVTLVDSQLPAQAASGRSFGWINASYSLSDAHLRLRLAGMAAHERLAQALPGLHRPCGCLWWEETGAEFEATVKRLQNVNYPLRLLDGAQLLHQEPCLKSPPDQAIYFPTEGWVDPVSLTKSLLAASGVTVLSGVSAQLLVVSGRAIGVKTAQGPLLADQVVIAAGTGTTHLLAPLGIAFPMLHRPGLILRTKPVAVRLSHILAAPEQELRQEDDGRLLAPAAAAHQSDAGADLTDPLVLAEKTIQRIAQLVDLPPLHLDEVLYAERPVPGDELPAIGPVPGVSGLWLSVMHSGVTLAAIAAETLAAEITGQDQGDLLSAFRPARLM